MSGERADRAGPHWIAVDWGTSNLRAWAMDAEGRALAETASPRGMGGLAPEDFGAALAGAVADWLPPAGLPGGLSDPVPTLICGMAGARAGWAEAPYAPVPCAPLDPARAITPPGADPRLDVRILPGLSQARPADVMRGEETQIAGLIARRPRFDGVVCLPGTHTKWAHISAEEVVSFRSFMTGELYALLSTASILRHGMGEDGAPNEVSPDAAADFAEALDAAMSRPESVAGLFALRAEHLLNDLPPSRARARLSGMLIGMELAASRPWWLGREVALIGAPGPTAGYATALEAQGAYITRLDPTEAVLDGLRAAHAALWEKAE